MPFSGKSAIYSAETGKSWIEKILPLAWEELCTSMGILAGVVVLKSFEDDSFMESASFGYGEDGFYYPFLARGESELEEVKLSLGPVMFSGETHSLFSEDANAYVMGIRCENPLEFSGFILAEFPKKDQNFSQLLYLFAEKIAKEIESIHIQKKYISEQAITPTPQESPFIIHFISGLNQKIEALKKEGYVSIFGKKGTGKRTLAKWIHSQTRPHSPCLFISSIPDHLGKLEKAISHWSEEIGRGTLVFSGPKKWSLGQQKILLDWVSTKLECQILFLDGLEEAEELLPAFGKHLRKNSIQVSELSFFNKTDIQEIATRMFQDLAREQNRSGLSLDAKALDSICEQDFPGNFTDLKNLLLSGILKCKSNIVTETDLDFSDSHLNLGVPDSEDLDLRRGIQALERQKILNAKRIFSGNQIRMAKALGISRGALQNKMKQLGLL